MPRLQQGLPVVVNGVAEDHRLIHVGQGQQVKPLLPRPAVGVVTAGSSYPDWRVRLLHWLWQESDALIAEELAGEIQRLSRPALPDDRGALTQAYDAVFITDADVLQLDRSPTPDPKV